MTDIKTKIVTWNESDRAVGERVYQRAGKHLEAALLAAYRILDPSLPRLADDLLAQERRKFNYISHGDFPPAYFDEQAIITKNIARSLDYSTYLSQVYAVYAATLASGLFKEKSWTEKNIDDLMKSLMKSVFSDASVVMFYYFELLNDKADEQRAVIEAERRRVVEEQDAVVATLADSLKRLAQGDLTARITAPFEGQYKQIKDDYNVALDSLRGAMSAISETTGGLHASADEIANASDDLSRRTEQQAASLEQTAAALDQITATVKVTASGAIEASRVVAAAKADAETSSEVVREAVVAMQQIQESSRKISEIIGVIDEIAFQTNLLALNAGVEAARAGEAGRGFAVVASEVRALAQRSAEAAKEIKALISASTEQVEHGVNRVGETGKSLARIADEVMQINSVVSTIAASAQEQATGLQQVNTAVNQMDQVTQQNAAMVEESTAAAHSMRQETNTLSELIGKFRFGETGTAAKSPLSVNPAHAAQNNIVAIMSGSHARTWGTR